MLGSFYCRVFHHIYRWHTCCGREPNHSLLQKQYTSIHISRNSVHGHPKLLMVEWLGLSVTVRVRNRLAQLCAKYRLVSTTSSRAAERAEEKLSCAWSAQKKKNSIHIGLGVRRSILTRSIATRSNPEVLFKALTLLVDLLHIYICIRAVALTTP